LVENPNFSHWCSHLLSRIGPEKGVIHIATGAVNNAIWDMFARKREKPLWKLITDMSPVRSLLSDCSLNYFHDHIFAYTQEELVRSTTFRYITDVITPEEALKMLKANESGKKEREQRVRDIGYPAYVTSAGWLGMIEPRALTTD